MLTKAEIVAGLRELGLGAGDIVIAHAALSSFGPVDGAAETVVDALLEAVAPGGTIVAPTFATTGDVFCHETSPTLLGAVPEALRRRKGAVRSLSPTASIAALGPLAEELCAGHDATETAHAEGTPYARIAAKGGYVLLLGVDQDRNTMLHAAEEIVRSPYLKTITRPLEAQGQRREVTYHYFPGPHREFIGLDKALRRLGVVRTGMIGAATVRLMKAKALVDTVVEMIRANPAALLCENPSCDDCVHQRAALVRHELAQERFTVAAQTQLAGWYPVEIADRLARAGLTHVEVDLVLGKDLRRLTDAEFADLAGVLKERRIGVSGVRLRAVPTDMAIVLDRARRLGAPRVVVPSSADLRALQAITRAGLTPVLENVAMGREELGARLNKAEAAGLPAVASAKAGVRCAFHPAEFARIGEKPFLFSFKRPVRKFVDVLYVGDGRFDGQPTALARGNAEIKELISILRCSGFAGAMVLTGAPGGLEERMREFMEILRSL